MSDDFELHAGGGAMKRVLQTAWQRGRSLAPVHAFLFDRPLVVLQSDDWGRVGVRDWEGWEQVRQFAPNLGERAYDYYSLETAEDVAATAALLSRHRDSSGRPACLGMNFVVANVDFQRVVADDFRHIYLRDLMAGLPEGWNRPGLFDAYREGIRAGVFFPALHGTTHFCQPAVERFLADPGERGTLMRGMWGAGTPYIHWRMPWVGFEYWDPEQAEQHRFLSADAQEELMRFALESFAKLFSAPPRSACAPGYRSNEVTHNTWAKLGIRVAQNGPGSARAPHFDRCGILQLYRAVEFEPATNPNFSLPECIATAEACFASGVPAIVSVHSINFHSTLRNFRGRTLELLDEFLSQLQSRHKDLLYVHDEDIRNLVEEGRLKTKDSVVKVVVTKSAFAGRFAARRGA